MSDQQTRWSISSTVQPGRRSRITQDLVLAGELVRRNPSRVERSVDISQRGPFQPSPVSDPPGRRRFWLPTIIPDQRIPRSERQNEEENLIHREDHKNQNELTEFSLYKSKTDREIKDLKNALSQKEKENKSLHNIIDHTIDEMNTLTQSNICITEELHQWLGMLLKTKWLIDRIKDVGGINSETSKEVLFQCFDDISIPEINEEIWSQYISSRLKEWSEDEDDSSSEEEDSSEGDDLDEREDRGGSIDLHIDSSVLPNIVQNSTPHRLIPSEEQRRYMLRLE